MGSRREQRHLSCAAQEAVYQLNPKVSLVVRTIKTLSNLLEVIFLGIL